MSNGGRGRVAWTGSSGAHTGNGLRGGEVTIGHKASPGHVPAADGMDGDEVGPDVDIATGESLQGVLPRRPRCGAVVATRGNACTACIAAVRGMRLGA
uniref:Uncharacterized protein n=1 Tax=Oryza nivara TaxID=4536 RepID=A0A0E0J1B5_ORYNI